MVKKILLGLLVALVIIQFIKPERNLSGDETYSVATKFPIPNDVKDILAVACNDCHSNTTKYPSYADWQPTAWWLNNHVKGGKKKLNFSTFTSLPIAVQNHKFEETIEMVKEKKMPISSYTWFGLHPEAKLTDAQRAAITGWAQANMDSLKANYPADSLIMKKRSKSGYTFAINPINSAFFALATGNDRPFPITISPPSVFTIFLMCFKLTR
jgi:hypothetical protein